MTPPLLELPEGWAWSTVGDVGEVMLGRQRAPRYHHGPNMRPYLRVANVFEDRIDIADVFEMDFPSADFERYRLEPGDILLNEGQSPELVGRPAMFRDEMADVCFTNSLIRFRPHEGIDGEFALLVFRHHLHSGRFQREARITTNIAHLSAKRFCSVEFPVPPLAEQRHIVERVVKLKRDVQAGRAEVAAAAASVDRLEGALIDAAFAEIETETDSAPLGDLIERITSGSRDWKPYYNSGSGVFVLAQNVRTRRLDFANVLNVDPPPGDSSRARSAIRKDDVLVTIVGAGTGTTARVSEDFNEHYVCQSVALIRPRADALDGSFLELYLSAPGWGQRIFGELMYGQGRPHLGFAEMKMMPIPVPPLEDQRALVDRVNRQLAEVPSLRAPVEELLDEAVTLERAIISSGVQGKLTARLSAADESTPTSSDAPTAVVRHRENGHEARAGTYS